MSGQDRWFVKINKRTHFENALSFEGKRLGVCNKTLRRFLKTPRRISERANVCLNISFFYVKLSNYQLRAVTGAKRWWQDFCHPYSAEC